MKEKVSQKLKPQKLHLKSIFDGHVKKMQHISSTQIASKFQTHPALHLVFLHPSASSSFRALIQLTCPEYDLFPMNFLNPTKSYLLGPIHLRVSLSLCKSPKYPYPINETEYLSSCPWCLTEQTSRGTLSPKVIDAFITIYICKRGNEIRQNFLLSQLRILAKFGLPFSYSRHIKIRKSNIPFSERPQQSLFHLHQETQKSIALICHIRHNGNKSGCHLLPFTVRSYLWNNFYLHILLEVT